jgi:exonuclease III
MNAARKIHKAREHKDEITYLMEKEKLDFLMLQELGKSDNVSIAMFKNYAIEKDMAVEIVSRGPNTTGGGQAILIGRRWAKLQRTIHTFNPTKADRDRVLAVEFNNKAPGDHNKLLVIGYYGYNNAASFRPEIKEMHKFIWTQIKKFRRDNPLASIILLGDFNAAKYTETDTDEAYESGNPVPEDTDNDGWAMEDDAFVIEHIEEMKLQDALRDRYPGNNFVTRKVTHQANRLLDRIFISKELSGPTMKAAIYQPAIFTYGGTDTDHKMVIVDLAIDTAGGAAQQVTLWSKHKKETLRWDADDVGIIAQEKIDEFNIAAAALQAKQKPTEPEHVHKWLLEAATGTVMKQVLQEFPKKARKPKNFQSSDCKIRTGLKKMREAIRHLEE